MSDIRSGLDVTLKDEFTGFFAQIDSSRDLFTKSKLWDGTNEVDLVFDAEDSKWRLCVDAKAKIEETPEGIFGDLFQETAVGTFTPSQSQDLISVVVGVDKIVFIRAFSGGGNKSGASKSEYILINKVGDAAETVVDRFFAESDEQHEFPRGIDFNAGDRIIVRVINSSGANSQHTVTLNGVEVDV